MSPLDPHWLELQRRFAYPPGAPGLPVLPPGAPGGPGGGGNHLPGVYPPVSLAGELAAREREKLERLGECGFVVDNIDIFLMMKKKFLTRIERHKNLEACGFIVFDTFFF
jgi:hypothetical protein